MNACECTSRNTLWNSPTLHNFSWVQADGTRYLLLACKWGTYLMDRSFRVRRVQMRFICPDMKTRHHNTLLDGEMVSASEVLQTRNLGWHERCSFV